MSPQDESSQKLQMLDDKSLKDAARSAIPLRSSRIAIGYVHVVVVPTLLTDRLRLRPLGAADRKALAAMFRERESSRFLGADFTDEQQLAAMHERRLNYQGTPGTGHWIAELRTGAIVGLLHLRDSWELPGSVAEIGWYLDPGELGKGYASEAAARLIDYGLDELGLPAIWALIHVDNAASQRVAQRLGMVSVGRDQHYGSPHLEWTIRRHE